jgi:hypothetical protein
VATAEVDAYSTLPDAGDPYADLPSAPDPYASLPSARDMAIEEPVRVRNLQDASLPRLEDPETQRQLPVTQPRSYSTRPVPEGAPTHYAEALWFRARNSALGQALLGRNAAADDATLRAQGVDPANKIPNRLETGGLVGAVVTPYQGALPRAGQAVSVPGQLAAGAYNATAGLAEGVATPLLPIGALPRAGRVLSGAFSVDMAAHTPGLVKQASEAIKEGDIQAATEGIIGAGATGAFAGMAGVHAVAGRASKAIVETAKPETAKPVDTPAPEVAPEPKPVVVETPAALERSALAPEPLPTTRGNVEEPIPAAAVGEGVKPTETAGGMPELPKATPEAPVASPEAVRQTSIKDAVVEQERAARGEEPLLTPQRMSHEQALAKAAEAEAADPTIAAQLTRIALAGERPLFNWEEGVLLRERVRLNNEFSKAVDAAEAAKKAGDDAAFAAATEKADHYGDLLGENERAVGHGGAGTVLARALEFRKVVMDDDFTLGRMETVFRKAHDFRRPTQEERSELKKIADDYKTAEQKVEAAAEKAAEAPVSKAEAIVQAMEEAADAAWLRIKSKLSQAGAIPDPTILSDLAIIGAAKIARGAVEFGKWADEMRKHVGSWMTPEDLKQVYDASKKQFAESKGESRRLSALKSRVARKKAQLEGQIASGDFTKPQKKPPVKPDQEALDAMFELEQVKKRWRDKKLEWEVARRSLPRKIFETARTISNTARDIMTSYDLSATLRQGGMVTLAHPFRASKAFVAAVKAMRSEKAQFDVEQEIMQRDNYPLYREAKLFLAEHGDPLTSMEESIRSTWSRKVPGVGMSQRHFTTFLNRLRADSFDAMLASLPKDGVGTAEQRAVIANFINKATGKGTTGLKGGWDTALSDIFFAPKYVASRFQILAGQPFYKGDAVTRKLIAKEYVRYLTSIALVMSLARLAGGTVENDTRSSEGWKAKFGNIKVDIGSGFQQVAVLLSRLVTGQTKNLRTGKVEKLTVRDRFGKPVKLETDLQEAVVPRMNVVGRFVRTKLGPIPGAIVDVKERSNVIGHPVTPESALLKLVLPISTGDLKEQAEEAGVPGSLPFQILSVLGANVQTYDSTRSKK